MSDETQSPRYSLKRKSITVMIEDEDGQERAYQIRELTGAQRNSYLEKTNAKMVMTSDGAVKPKTFKGTGSDLLCMCLYDDQGQRVRAEVIDEWPSEMQFDLYKKAADLSGLTKKGEEEAKND